MINFTRFFYKLANKILIVPFTLVTLFLAISSTVWKPLEASVVPGSDMLYMNRGLESFALGGVSAGLEMKGSSFIVNPALASTILQKMVMANIGYGTESVNFLNVGYLHPTEYGVFGGHYSHFLNQETDDFFFTVGTVFSKEISRVISLGGIIMFDYYRIGTSEIEDDQVWGVNASLSVSFKPNWNYGKGVFTIKDFITSAQIDQLGLSPWKKSRGNTYYTKVADIIKLGVGFTFLQSTFSQNSGIWKLRIYSDLALTLPIDFAYNVGLKNSFLFNGKFKELSLMVGHQMDPALFDTIPVTGGLATAFMLDNETKMEITYAFGLNRRNSTESYHSLGFNISFGEVDNLEPEISSPFGNEGVIDVGEIE